MSETLIYQPQNKMEGFRIPEAFPGEKTFDMERIAIFRTYAQKRKALLTHVTDLSPSSDHLPDIIQSDHLGQYTSLHPSKCGFYTETINFSWNPRYGTGVSWASTNDILLDNYVSRGEQSITRAQPGERGNTFIPSRYIIQEYDQPIFVFDSKQIPFSQRVKKGSYFILPTMPLSDPRLMNIIISDEKREQILTMIHELPKANVQKIFGTRNISALFISKAEQLTL